MIANPSRDGLQVILDLLVINFFILKYEKNCLCRVGFELQPWRFLFFLLAPQPKGLGPKRAHMSGKSSRSGQTHSAENGSQLTLWNPPIIGAGQVGSPFKFNSFGFI